MARWANMATVARAHSDASIASAFGTLAFLTLLPGITRVPFTFWDETIYVNAAHQLGQGVFRLGGHFVPWNPEHPPLWKIVLWFSMNVFGDNPIGWRLPSTIMGAIGVSTSYLVSLRLFHSRPAGVIAATFLMLEPMWRTHSQMAMLDLPGATFALLAVLFSTGRRRPWAAAACLGLGVATKLTVLFMLPVYAYLWRDQIRNLALALPFYVGAHVPYMVLALRHGWFGSIWAGFLFPLVYHHHADVPLAPMYSSPWTWFVGGGTIALGQLYIVQANVILLWAAITAACLGGFTRHRGAGLATCMVAFALAPFFLVDTMRVSYVHWLTFTTPFLCILTAGAVVAGMAAAFKDRPTASDSSVD